MRLTYSGPMNFVQKSSWMNPFHFMMKARAGGELAEFELFNERLVLMTGS